VDGFAGLAATVGNRELALRLSCATRALRDAHKFGSFPADAARLDRWLQPARKALGEVRAAAANRIRSTHELRVRHRGSDGARWAGQNFSAEEPGFEPGDKLRRWRNGVRQTLDL